MTRATVPLLAVRDLHVAFDTPAGRLTAVDGISFAIEPGATLALVGESGCGKSLTALALLRLLPPGGRITSGTIQFQGKDLLAQDPEAMRRLRGRDLAMVFQEPTSALNPVFRCGDQLAETIRAHVKCTRAEARERGLEMLRRVHLPDPSRVARAYPHELSGGMCQRVALALALACGPSLLIADEPTTALDVTIQAQICDLLLEIQAATGMALLLVSHDLGLVAGMADRIAIMYAGRIVEQGPTRAVFEAPRHPYTLGLLRSLPTLQPHPGRLPSIPGSVPGLDEVPPYCRFQPRCSHALEVCTRDDPQPRNVAAEHEIACFAELRERP
jgi:oligopeptide/dipeptide ABC transporter ATP-binding protein